MVSVLVKGDDGLGGDGLGGVKKDDNNKMRRTKIKERIITLKKWFEIPHTI